MARCMITIVTDGRQLQRELALVDEKRGREIAAAMNRDEPVIWIDTEFFGDQMISTPRLCHG